MMFATQEVLTHDTCIITSNSHKQMKAQTSPPCVLWKLRCLCLQLWMLEIFRRQLLIKLERKSHPFFLFSLDHLSFPCLQFLVVAVHYNLSLHLISFHSYHILIFSWIACVDLSIVRCESLHKCPPNSSIFWFIFPLPLCAWLLSPGINTTIRIF